MPGIQKELSSNTSYYYLPTSHSSQCTLTFLELLSATVTQLESALHKGILG